MITWGTADGSGLTPTEHDDFRGALKGHAWAEAFPGAVVVALIYEDERREVIDALAEVAQQVSEKRPEASRALLLVSPPIPKENGIYSGWAPKRIWPELNKRSIE